MADESFGTVVVCSSVAAIVIGAVYWMSRSGFSNPVAPVLRTVGFSLFLISFPHSVRHLIALRTGKYSWLSSYCFLWLVALAFTAAAGRIAGEGSVSSGAVLGVAGAIAFVLTLISWLQRESPRTSAAIIGGSGAFALWTSGVVWGRIYKNPLFFENLAVSGVVHHDSLPLMAFASMLRTYGSASTGLDGLPYTAYHWGSMWLFAQWSNLLGVDSLDFYQLAFPVIAIPLFFGAILAVATEIGRLSGTAARGPLSGVRPWLVLLVASVGVIPVSAMDSMGVWTSNVVISESYTVAVPVALLLLATAFVFWKTRGNKVTDSFFVLAIFPLGIVALGYVKISLMVLGFGLSLYLGFRLRLYRHPLFAAAGVVLVLLVFLTYGRVSQPAHNEGFAAFDFLNAFVPRPWWPFFFVIHLLWSWVFVVLRLRYEGVRTLGDLYAAIRERRLLDAESVVVIAAAGIAPGLAVHIDGGSAFYFSDVQRWLSVALLVAAANVLMLPNRTGTGEPGIPARPAIPAARAQHSLSRTPAVFALVAFIAIPLLISMGANALRWPAQMLRDNAATRRAVYQSDGGPPSADGIRALPRLIEPGVLQPGIRNSRNIQVLDQLRALSRLPRDERRRTALFIPQSETAYWSILARPGACTYASFIAPALSGMAMIDGMPAFGCKLSRYYGLGAYSPRRRAQTAEDESAPALCARARRSQLDRVLILRFQGAGVLRSQRIDCPAGAALSAI